MIVVMSWFVVCMIVLFGLVLNRVFVRSISGGERLLATDSIRVTISGVLPGLAMVGGLSTVLGALQLFKIEIIISVFLAIFFYFRRDLQLIIKDIYELLVEIPRGLKIHDPVPAIIALFLLMLAVILTVRALFPSGNADIWVFQIPLAQSIISHSGIISPQIDHPFYGNIPQFFNILFAVSMIFVDNWIAANILNIAIYFGFIGLLSTCASKSLRLGFFGVMFFVVGNSFFTPNVSVPLTDLPRSCFTVAALLLTWRFTVTNNNVYLFQACLVLGGALASKYTELVTLGLIVMALAPSLIKKNINWKVLVISFLSCAVISGYWYVKNLLILGNPVYPFLFAHPGLTDQWMADYMLEMRRSFDPAYRNYVTDLFRLQGWRDFILIFYKWFIQGRLYAYVALLSIISAVIINLRAIILLIAWTVVMFIIWYALMFNHIRWAMPANLLFYSSAVISVEIVLKRLELILARSIQWLAQTLSYINNHTYSKYRRNRYFLSLVIIVVMPLCIHSFITLHKFTVNFLQSQNDPQFRVFRVILGVVSLEHELEDTLEGYKIYRYIGQNNLRVVFQPFDTSPDLNAAAYNNGKNGQWLLPRYVLPEPGDDIDSFVKKNNIKYFITRPDVNELLIERLGGGSQVAKANAVIEMLRPYSELVMRDKIGWELYRVR